VVSPRLLAGDVVLLYTDGLLERRAAGTAAQFDEIMRTLPAVSMDRDEQALARLHALLRRASPHDDICAVAVRVLP
jgi:serine phosphatase RsbU (regulator of sigma subunit)